MQNAATDSILHRGTLDNANYFRQSYSFLS